MANANVKSMENTAREMAGTVDDAAGDVAKQLAVLREDIAALTRAVAASGRAKADEASNTVLRAGRSAAHQAEESYGSVKAKVEDLTGQAEQFVKDRPNAALGLAAGLGFLAGLLLVRRH